MSDYSWVPFHIVACSTEEPGTQIEHLSGNIQSSKGWESGRQCDFPLEIVLRFHHRSDIQHIVIATKENKNIPEIRFWMGDGLSGGFLDCEYSFVGAGTAITNKSHQIKVAGIGSFLKILIPTSPGRSNKNPYGQISLGLLKIWGKSVSYLVNSNDDIITGDDPKKIDKILMGLGFPADLLYWFEQDGRMFEHAPIDEETRITLKDLQTQKHSATKQEDFQALKQLTIDIKNIFEIGKEIWSLSKQLQIATAKENYGKAIELKEHIKRLETRRDAFDALYETSRYEKMIRMTYDEQMMLTGNLNRERDFDLEDESSSIDEMRRRKDLEEKERRQIIEQEKQKYGSSLGSSTGFGLKDKTQSFNCC